MWQPTRKVFRALSPPSPAHRDQLKSREPDALRASRFPRRLPTSLIVTVPKPCPHPVSPSTSGSVSTTSAATRSTSPTLGSRLRPRPPPPDARPSGRGAIHRCTRKSLPHGAPLGLSEQARLTPSSNRRRAAASRRSAATMALRWPSTRRVRSRAPQPRRWALRLRGRRVLRPRGRGRSARLYLVVAGPGQGKAGKTGPGQTKPRQGTTGKPAKPKQDFGACPRLWAGWMTLHPNLKSRSR